MKIKKCLEDIRHQYIGILSENLTGIYLHGSFAFHCFQWERSDIDFIAQGGWRPLPRERFYLKNRGAHGGFGICRSATDLC